MAHLRIRILPDGSQLYTVITTVGGTEVEESLNGVANAELHMIPGGSMLRLNFAGGLVEFVSDRPQQNGQDNDIGSEKPASAGH